MSKSIALIGYGYWGKKLFGYVRDFADFTLKYVYFRSLSKLSSSEIAEQFGPAFEPSLDKILNDPQLDAVIAATPIDTHYAVVRRVLEAGKHVLAEKPLTLDAAQARELADLALQKNVCLVTDYTYTFSPALNKAAEMVRQGAIGAVQSVTIDWLQYGRFAGFDVYALIGSHALSILDMFVPLDRLELDADALHYKDGLVTESRISFRNPGGDFQGTINVSLLSQEKVRLVRVEGDRRSIEYTPLAPPVLKMLDGERTFDFDESHNLALALKYFDDVMKASQPGNTGSSVKITELIAQWGKRAAGETL